MSSNASGPTVRTSIAMRLEPEGRGRVIDDGGRAVGREMVRAAQAVAQVGLDLGHALLGVALDRELGDLVHAQALAVAVVALALPEAIALLALDDQPAVPAADRIDEERVLRVRPPVRAERRVRREEVKLRAMVAGLRLVDVDE